MTRLRFSIGCRTVAVVLTTVNIGCSLPTAPPSVDPDHVPIRGRVDRNLVPAYDTDRRLIDAIPHAAVTVATRRLAVSIRGTEYELEALALSPPGTGPFPLAVVSHGKPRRDLDRRSLSLRFLLPAARDFARRGYYTVVFARRGYASSTGDYGELSDCNDRTGGSYLVGGAHAADDYQAVIEALASTPGIDGSRVIAVGESAGGFAATALASRDLDGLVGVVSFSGGRGSRGDLDVCGEDRLVAALSTFGRSARVPALWLYSETDRFFWPGLVQRMLSAYADEGAPVRLEMIGPLWFAEDGHYLVNLGGRELWRPRIDAFLNLIGAQNWREDPGDASVTNWDPPPALSSANHPAWRLYLGRGDHKAFAMGPHGIYGWSVNQQTPELARSQALRACEGEGEGDSCRVISVAGGEPIGIEASRSPVSIDTATASGHRSPTRH